MPEPVSDDARQSGNPGPNRILDTADRRFAAGVYLAAALVAAVVVIVTGTGLMWATAVLPLVAIAAYHVVTSQPLVVRDMEAIRIASSGAGFDVGHASATLGFVGVRARPVWEVLAFESGGVPGHQALVTVDALTGDVTGSFSEAVVAP